MGEPATLRYWHREARPALATHGPKLSSIDADQGNEQRQGRKVPYKYSGTRRAIEVDSRGKRHIPARHPVAHDDHVLWAVPVEALGDGQPAVMACFAEQSWQYQSPSGTVKIGRGRQ